MISLTKEIRHTPDTTIYQAKLTGSSTAATTNQNIIAIITDDCFSMQSLQNPMVRAWGQTAQISRGDIYNKIY